MRCVMIVSALLFLAGVTPFGGTAFAQEIRLPDANDFNPIYKRYADGINKEGGKALREFASPDFVAYDAMTNKPVTGKPALTEAAKLFDRGVLKQPEDYSTQYTVEFSVTDIAEKEVVVYTKEIDRASTKPVRLSGDVNNGTLAASSGQDRYFKHVWRKTPEGWKLASLQRDPRSESERSRNRRSWFTVKSAILPATSAENGTARR